MPTGQHLDLDNLPAYWRTLREEFSTVESLPPLKGILSARAFDESQVAGPRTYMAVSRYLAVARDNHEALVALLQHHGATIWAPWSLLRPTFEAAFWAVWILDPADGRERRARGLHSEIVDAYEQRRHWAAYKTMPEIRQHVLDQEARSDAGSIAVYRAEAAALGRNFDTLRRRKNLIDEIPRLSQVVRQPGLAPFIEAAWRQLSGFEHGLGWALLSGTDHEVTAEIPGGAEMHLVINDDAFVIAAKTTYLFLVSACRLFATRHLKPAG